MIIMNHAYWTEYLKSARNGHDRPIDGSRTKRVLHGPDDSIILRLHSTDVVTLHADGTETINTGGWHTVSTMRFISEHSRARVWSVSYQLYVRSDNPTFTAPRVQKCRRCHGNGSIPSTCSGVKWCYSGRQGYCYEWGSRPDEHCEHGEIDHHRLPCSHGRTAAHALPSVECWQCHGVGRFDYGSNPVHYQWDGGPLTIDCHGYPVGPAPRPVIRRYVYVPPAVPTECDSYGVRYSETGLGKYASSGGYERDYRARPARSLSELLTDIEVLTDWSDLPAA